METPTVFLICGNSGVGKTTMLNLIVQKSPDTRIALLAPGQIPDWDALDVVAVDEDWRPADVETLELAAIENGKFLLAVAQRKYDITFKREPAVLTIQGAHARGVFSYKDRELEFP